MARKKVKQNSTKAPKHYNSDVVQILCKLRKYKTQYLLKLIYINFNLSAYL